MKSRLLDFDPVTRVRRMFHPSVDGDSFIEEGVQDVSGRIEINKALQNENRNGYGDGRRMASIPLVVWEDLMRRGIAEDKKRLRDWLNDSDNLVFRTMLGRI